MAEEWQIDLQQNNALKRLEQSHKNAMVRQEKNEVRRQAFQHEAVIVEGENAETLMNLKHELDKENRLLDHAFNRAEDMREVERLATEISMRRRDDYIRHQWNSENGLFELEAKVIAALASGAIAERQSHINHAHNMEAKTADHDNNMEFETHKTDEEMREFEFKERLKDKLVGNRRAADEDTVTKIVTKLKNNN